MKKKIVYAIIMKSLLLIFLSLVGEGSYLVALKPSIAVYPKLPSTDTQVKNKLDGSIALEADTSYKYDLNGDGKEETIKYTVNSSPVEINLYINNHKIYTKEGDGFTFFAALSNIDKSDKYLEICFIGFGGDNYMSSLDIYHYTNSTEGLTELFTYPTTNDIYDLDYAQKPDTNGDGTFTWASGSVKGLSDYYEYIEIYEGVSGLGSCKNIKFILKDGKITLYSKEFTGAGYTISTLKNISLVDAASTKGKKVTTVKAGSSVTVTKIKYVKKGEAYLLIKYGKISGWYHLKPGAGVVFKG